MKEREGPDIPEEAKSKIVCPFCGSVWKLSGQDSLAIAITNRIVCPQCNKTILVKARPRVTKLTLAV